MPDKPSWYGRLNEAIARLNDLPYPWVDRGTVEELLGVGRRRAQQILRPVAVRKIGASVVADRAELIGHLQALAGSDAAYYERQRRRKLAESLAPPAVLVAAPEAVRRQEFANLPEGVAMSPGKISIAFASPSEALKRLLELAMAIGNDFDEFERIVGR